MPKLEVRLTEEQDAALREKVAKSGMTRSGYVRTVLGIAQGIEAAARSNETTAEKAPAEPRRASPPERVDEATRLADAPQEPSERYRCPATSCRFVARSQAARCPIHGKLVR